MSALGDVVRRMIVADGPITLERYMALALGHPTLGYYMTRDPMGAAGDFITAPEISQMFGELIGLWCADYWVRMGRPRRFNLVELGPGRGTLMADALRAVKVVPGFLASAQVSLVEMSPVLRNAQQSRLGQSGAALAWRDRVEDVPEGPMILVANEFFDALPVRHYVKSRGGWRERVVGMAPDGRLIFGVGLQFERSLTVEAPEGSIIEVCPTARLAMCAIAARVAQYGGAALAIDYGYEQTSLGETLQAMRAHAFTDPLEEPGDADLTTHVDFSALARAARASGAQPYGLLRQGEFLRRLGLFDRAKALVGAASPAQAGAIASAVDRLTGSGDDSQGGPDREGGMGGLFKAFALGQIGAPIPAGFELRASAP